MPSGKPSVVRVSGHQPGLDGVRGLAIIGVMVLHFVGDSTTTTALERAVTKASSYGLLGVDLFFVLSGFLITGLLLDAKGKPSYFRNFYARRTLRIFPLYYFVLAVLFLVLPIFMTLPPALELARQKQVWLWTYLTNFYIAAKSAWALGYVSHFWSLAIEEHFYLVWPLVVFSVRRETLVRICLAVIGGGLLLRIALALSGMSELSISVLTYARVDTLCVGGLLAALARGEQGAEPVLRRAPRVAVGVAVVTVAVSAWCATTNVGLPVLHQIRNSLYAFFFGALTLLSIHQPEQPEWLRRILDNAVLRAFGTYSYGLYVYHGMLQHQFQESEVEQRLTAALGSHGAAMFVKAALGFAISYAIAWVSYHVVEKRFLALKRYFEAPPAPSARPAVAPAAASLSDAGR